MNDKPQIVFSFANCPPDIKRVVMTVFRGLGNDCTEIIMEDAPHYPFPVKAVDKYLSKNPEKVRNVTKLYLEFSKRNHVQLLEMVRKRFPNIRALKLPRSIEHPIGHALGQYAQMPHLETLHFGYCVEKLAEYAQTNDLIPLPQVKTLYCCIVGTKDTYKDFEATLPIIFPNLESLHYLGPGEELTEQIYANLKRLFPKIQLCKVVDSSELSAIVQEQENPQFPINLGENSDIKDISIDNEDWH